MRRLCKHKMTVELILILIVTGLIAVQGAGAAKPTTTPAPTTPALEVASCVRSCEGKPDGFYQSCATCNGYAICRQGAIRVMRCHPGESWDSRTTKCEKYLPTTCTDSCIDSDDCSGLPDGRYQYCNRCDMYAFCERGKVLRYHQCDRDWSDPALRCKNCVYDDIWGECRGTSTTCFHK